MHLRATRFLPAVLLVVVALPVSAMEIVWTRMTGQYPVESAPLVADVGRGGTPEIVAVNRMGQVMRWGLDGKNHGSGQDGTVLQLPEGTWSSSPALVDGPQGPRLVLASGEGLVVALDKDLSRILWKYPLGGKTRYAHAAPTILPTPKGPGLCFGDHQGTVACLDLDGSVLWKTALKTGACDAAPAVVVGKQQEAILLVPCGSILHAIGPDGAVRWSQDLKGQISVQPESFSYQSQSAVLCGGGELVALTPDRGEVLWTKKLAGEIDSAFGVLSISPDRSLLLHTGLWGNLYALDTAGHPVWQSIFRSKNRGRPLVCDLNGDGHSEILVAAYNQHLYEFSDRGTLLDDVRVCGGINGSPVLIQSPGQTRPDVLIVTAAELAYRLRPGKVRSPYGETGKPEEVALTPPTADNPRTIVVDNPHGALLRANVSSGTEHEGAVTRGTLTARSRFELALPTGAVNFHATVESCEGRLLAERSLDSLPPELAVASPAGDAVTTWAAPAYASFDATRLTAERQKEIAVEIRNLYQNEVDQSALVAASTWKEPLRARVIVSPLTTADKTPFGGTLTLREVVVTGTVNGEPAADALPGLGAAGLITLVPQRATKIWVSVDAHGAKPGVYEGKITVQPLTVAPAARTIPIRVEVPGLALDKHFPLALCTWDYVPNNWFPDQTEAVLDDMTRHGVSIWPRSDCIPPAKLDTDGKLVFDWSKLDVAMRRFQGRGQILFQVTTPPITFATPPSPEAKHQAELAYLRSWRDYLRAHGWNYADYAFYPLDEPGLDYGKNLSVLVNAAKLFREADPKFRIYTDPVPTLCWADFQQIEPLIDVWCPVMRLVSGLLANDPRIRRIVDSKKTVWSYECISQVKSLSPLCYNRANAWRGYYFGLTGIGFWTHSTTDVDHWLPGKTINDEYALVYPGTLPVPSVRWEAVRDGLEDVGAMALLRRAIAEREQDGAKPELVRAAKEALRIAQVDILSLSDEVFIESRDYLRQGDRRLWHTPTDVETYARHRARFAELTKALQK